MKHAFLSLFILLHEFNANITVIRNTLNSAIINDAIHFTYPSKVRFPVNQFVQSFSENEEARVEAQASARNESPLDQKKRRKMSVYDGWDYFLLGWSSVMEEVFHFELTESLMRQLKQTAKPLRNE